MRNSALISITAAVLALSACGNDLQTASSDEQAQAETVPEITVDRTFIGTGGRWSTDSGIMPDNRRIVIDIASNGRFSIDLRAQSANGESIIESGRGSATKDGAIITGSTDEGQEAGGVLGRYAKWAINTESRKITSALNETMPITKE